MSDPIPSSSESKVNSKPEVVQKIAGSLQAKNQFDQIHGEWQKNAKIAAETGSQIPEEPTASPDALRGQTLSQAQNEISDKVKSCFDSNISDKSKNVSEGKRIQNLNDKLNKIIQEINDNPDQESRIIQVAGALDSFRDNIFSSKWEQTSHLLDVSPEALYFSDLTKNFDPATYNKNNYRDGLQSLKTDAAQNVLKHLSSESSPVNPQKKEEYRFAAEEGKGMKAFDVLFSTEAQNITPEQFISVFGLGEKITPADINSAKEKLRDRIRENMQNPSFAETLSMSGFITSLENVPLLLSQLVSQKPEIAEELKGKLVGCCRSLADKRPDIRDGSYGLAYDRNVSIYMRITHKIEQSLVDLYSKEINIYDVIKQEPRTPFDKEFQTLNRDYNIGNFMDSQSPLKTHFNTFLKNKDITDAEARRQQQIKNDQEKIDRQNFLMQEKQKQEELVNKYLNNQKIQEAIYPLWQSKNGDLSSNLAFTQKTLETLQPNSVNEVSFAESVVQKFNQIISENPTLAAESDREVSRHKKGLFGNKYIVGHQITFTLNQENYDQLSKQIQKQISEDPSIDNYATQEALNLVLKRSQIRRGYQREE